MLGGRWWRGDGNRRCLDLRASCCLTHLLLGCIPSPSSHQTWLCRSPHPALRVPTCSPRPRPVPASLATSPYLCGICHHSLPSSTQRVQVSPSSGRNTLDTTPTSRQATAPPSTAKSPPLRQERRCPLPPLSHLCTLLTHFSQAPSPGSSEMTLVRVRGKLLLAKARVTSDSILACSLADTPLFNGRVLVLGPDASHPCRTPFPWAVAVLLDLAHSQTSKTKHAEISHVPVFGPAPALDPKSPPSTFLRCQLQGEEEGPRAVGGLGLEFPLRAGSSAWHARSRQASLPPASCAPSHLPQQRAPDTSGPPPP